MTHYIPGDLRRVYASGTALFDGFRKTLIGSLLAANRLSFPISKNSHHSDLEKIFRRPVKNVPNFPLKFPILDF